jgi:chitin-binding protein
MRPLLTWTDNSVEAETLYHYFVSAIDVLGNVSLPSRAIEVRTLSEDGAPSAPVNLHSMSQTAQSISLMWGASSGAAPIEKYLIYRNGAEVKSVSANQTSFDDTGLTPDTEYSYVVKALDQKGKLSLPSNVLKVKTRDEGGGYPAWKLNTVYEKTTWSAISASTGAAFRRIHLMRKAGRPGEGDNVLWAEES